MIKLRMCGMAAVCIVVGILWVLSVFGVAVSLFKVYPSNKPVKNIVIAVFGVTAVFAVSIAIVGLFVFGICQGLSLIGITTVMGWEVCFSWPLAILVWIVIFFINTIRPR